MPSSTLTCPPSISYTINFTQPSEAKEIEIFKLKKDNWDDVMISESCTNLKINAVDELTDDSDSFIKNIQILRVQSTHRLKTEKMVRAQVAA